MIRVLLTLLALSVLCSGESLRITVSHQPYEVFKASFGGGLKGVGLYQATTCNATDAGIRFSEGIVIQAVERKVATVNSLLAFATANRAKRRSKIQTAARISEYVLMGGAIFTAGGTIAASNAVKLALVAGQGFAGKLAEDAQREAGLDLSALSQFLDSGRSMVLEPRACSARLVLGSYRKNFDPFEVIIP